MNLHSNKTQLHIERRPTRLVDIVVYTLPVVDNNISSTFREEESNPESVQ